MLDLYQAAFTALAGRIAATEAQREVFWEQLHDTLQDKIQLKKKKKKVGGTFFCSKKKLWELDRATEENAPSPSKQPFASNAEVNVSPKRAIP